MSTTYNWIVEQMSIYPEKDGHSNVVFSINWRCNANYGDYSATSYSSIELALDPNAQFTPYADLTEDQVLGWLKSAIGEENISQVESSLDARIKNLMNPPIVTMPNPWNNKDIGK